MLQLWKEHPLSGCLSCYLVPSVDYLHLPTSPCLYTCLLLTAEPLAFRSHTSITVNSSRLPSDALRSSPLNVCRIDSSQQPSGPAHRFVQASAHSPPKMLRESTSLSFQMDLQASVVSVHQLLIIFKIYSKSRPTPLDLTRSRTLLLTPNPRTLQPTLSTSTVPLTSKPTKASSRAPLRRAGTQVKSRLRKRMHASMSCRRKRSAPTSHLHTYIHIHIHTAQHSTAQDNHVRTQPKTHASLLPQDRTSK